MSSNFCSFSEPQHGSERVADTLDFPSASRGQGTEDRGQRTGKRTEYRIPNAQRRTSNAELPRFKDVTIQRFNAATRSAASGREIATFDGMHFSVLTAMASQSNSWLQWTLWAVIMSLVMGCVARSRMRPRPACCDQQLRHPVSTLIIGLAGFLLDRKS